MYNTNSNTLYNYIYVICVTIDIQLDQIYMAVLFWYLVKVTVVYATVHIVAYT